jgi:hypothetical protein
MGILHWLLAIPSFTYLLQAVITIFSVLAGWFWMTSATGYPINFRFGKARRVDPADFPTFQSCWNARAAFCAAIAALAQAVFFLYTYPPNKLP